jgi:CRISPR-associated protein Csm3
MHKRRVNELKVTAVIEPDGPLLIKSGDDGGLDPTLPTMNFVRSQHPRHGQQTIYLPGSSLKGVIRSHSERILHTVFGDDARFCCDPLSRRDSCQSRVKNIKDTAEQYRKMCLACRTFGHMDNASHFLAADAYPDRPINELPVRQNVAIDRLSGGVAVGPFDMEVALEGAFGVTLRLFNYELWQVGLLALTLRDIGEGRVRLGFAKSRGLGAVRLALQQLEIGYPGQFGESSYDFAQQMVGVSALASDLKTNYGYVDGEDVAAYPVSGTFTAAADAWGRPQVVFAGQEAIEAVLGQSVAAWADFIPVHKEKVA